MRGETRSREVVLGDGIRTREVSSLPITTPSHALETSNTSQLLLVSEQIFTVTNDLREHDFIVPFRIDPQTAPAK